MARMPTLEVRMRCSRFCTARIVLSLIVIVLQISILVRTW